MPRTLSFSLCFLPGPTLRTVKGDPVQQRCHSRQRFGNRDLPRAPRPVFHSSQLATDRNWRTVRAGWAASARTPSRAIETANRLLPGKPRALLNQRQETLWESSPRLSRLFPAPQSLTFRARRTRLSPRISILRARLARTRTNKGGRAHPGADHGQGALVLQAQVRDVRRGFPGLLAGEPRRSRGQDAGHSPIRSMKLCQFYLPKRGRRVGAVDGAAVADITSARAGVTSVLGLIQACGTAERIEARVQPLLKAARTRIPWSDLDRAPSPRHPHLLAPLDAPEVWGAGITYRRSMQYYEAHTETGGRTRGIYDHVYESERPELFFKATGARTVGPNDAVAIRRDSMLTATEPELALVVGALGRIVGYTVGNDLSAWDIERANPLFLPQSKIFAGCFAMGPVLATPREVGDPHALDLVCRISRDGVLVFEGRVNTGEMKRRCPDLVVWLVRDNPVPPGTVLSTGTGILVPDEHALREGDVVEIQIAKIGTLRNVVKRLR